MSKTLKNLRFYERQFNTIKGLIPIANSCISASIEPDKLVTGFFRKHSMYWDVMQSPIKKKLWEIGLTTEEEYALSERIVQMMNLLVHVKKTSQSANLSQNSNKITLYELLVRLRDHVLKENNGVIIPSFTLPGKSQQPDSFKRKFSLSFPSMTKNEKKLFDLCVHGIKAVEIPWFVSEALNKQMRHLYHLAHLGKSYDKQWKNEMGKYAALQKRSLAAGKEYEGKAYEIICNMLRVNRKLHQSIRDQANPQYEKFVIKMEEMVQYFKEKGEEKFH